MNHKFFAAAVLCFALVTVMALADVPAASAKAEIMTGTGIETYAAPPNPTTPDPLVTGGVAHWTFNNVLREEASTPLLVGNNSTHMVVVFDPASPTWAGRCHGTWRLIVDGGLGTWEGTFAGSISLLTGAYDIRSTGKGVSGAVAGMIFVARDVNATEAYGEVKGTVIAPHGF